MSEMRMTREEYADLRAAVARYSHNDAALGRILDMLVLHIGHGYGFDPTQEDKRLAMEKRKADRLAEDERLKEEADALIQSRAAEDSQAWTPVQAAALKSARAQEDQRIKDKADELAKKRTEEDALNKADDTAPKDSQPITTAPVKPSTNATTNPSTTTTQTGAL